MRTIRLAAGLGLIVGLLAASMAGAATLRGTVIAADGTPAAGAEVWAVNFTGFGFDRRATVADEAGRYAMQVGPGLWITEARLGDQGPIAVPPSVAVGAMDPPSTTIRLKPQGRLRARLVEVETGRPVAGARFGLDNGLDPTTDDDGRVEIRGLSRRSRREAIVVAPGRERLRVLFELSDGPATDLEVAIPRGAKIIGRVLDGSGRPIAGAAVSRTTPNQIVALSSLRTQTDREGRYEFEGFAVDQAGWLDAEAEGFEFVHRTSLRAPIDGSPLRVDFQLMPVATRPALPPDPANSTTGRELQGVVVDPTGRPVSARLRWNVSSLIRSAIDAETDATGRFRLAPIPEESGVVFVLPERMDLALTTVVVDRTDREVRIVLEPGHVASGVLRDADGTTYPGAALIPSVGKNGPGRWSLIERRVLTDEQGRFKVEGLPSAEVTATFAGEGMMPIRSLPLELDRENLVAVEPAGTLHGRVIDNRQHPVRNFRVLLRAPRERHPDDKAIPKSIDLEEVGLTCTADDGTFQVRNLTAGARYRLVVLAPGFGAEAVDRAVALPPKLRTSWDVVSFELGPPSVLEVRVREPDSGRPVPNARVAVAFTEASQDDASWTVNEGRSDLTFARTDAEGRASFPALSFDEGTVLIQASGYARQRLGWRDHSANLVAWLQPEAAIEGTIVDAATGRPPEGAVVVVRTTWAGRIAALLEPPAGRFRIDELPAGRYAFSVATPGHPNLLTEEIRLVEGERAVRQVRLKIPGR